MNTDFLKVFAPGSNIYKDHIKFSTPYFSELSHNEYKRYLEFCKNISKDEKLNVKSFTFDSIEYGKNVKLNIVFDYDGKEYTSHRVFGKIINIESNCGAYLYDNINYLLSTIEVLKTQNDIRRFLTLLFDKLQNDLNKNILTFTGNFATRNLLLIYLFPNISESQYTMSETKFKNKNSGSYQVVGNINARASSVLPLLKQDKNI